MPKMKNCWISVLILSLLGTGKLSAETFLSLTDLQQVHQKHFHRLRTGEIKLLYDMTREVDEKIFQQRKEELIKSHQTMWSNEKMEKLSDEMKRKVIESHERNLQNLLKLHSRWTTAEWWYRIDMPNRLFWRRETPRGEQREEKVVNGAWNRCLLVDGKGNSLSYDLDSDTASLHSIDPRAFDRVYADILYYGVILPEQWERLDKITAIRKGQIDDHDVVIYEMANSKESDWKVVLYVDSNVEYRYRKMEVSSQNHLSQVQIAREYQKIDGIFYPMYFETIQYDVSTGKLQKREVFHIQDARFNQPFDPNAFTVELKPTTVVAATNIPGLSASLKSFRPKLQKESLRVGIDEILEQARQVPDILTKSMKKGKQE